MAERVQVNLEKFDRYCKYLISLRMIDKYEAKNMIEERRKLEYGICKRVADPKDFKVYIKYEIAVYKLLQEKAAALRSDVDGISHAHQKIIHSLFRRALQKFKDHMKFWKLHFQFCIETKDNPIFESSISNFIRLHFSRADAWIIAAEFYYQINPLISEKLLEKGLKHLPNSPELNSAFFITYCKNEDIRQNSVDYHQLILNLYNDCQSIKFLSESIKFLENKNNYKDILFQTYNLFSDYEDKRTDPDHISAVIFLAFQYQTFDNKIALEKCNFYLFHNDFSEIFWKIFSYIIDNLISRRDTSNITEWNNLLTSSLLEDPKNISPDTTCKILDFYICYDICINEKLRTKILKLKNWNCIEKYIKCCKNKSFDDFINFYSQVMRSYPENQLIIIDYFSERIADFGNKEYFMKSYKYIKKNYILCLFRFIENLFNFMVNHFSYNGWKKMILKNISKCTPTLILLLSIKDFETSREIIDFDFLRRIYDAYIRPTRENEVEFWISYLQIESLAMRLSQNFETHHVNKIYNKAIRNLTGQNVQDFIVKYNFLAF